MYTHTFFYGILGLALMAILSALYQAAQDALDWLAQQGISEAFFWWALLTAAGCVACLWTAERVGKPK